MVKHMFGCSKEVVIGVHICLGLEFEKYSSQPLIKETCQFSFHL